MILCQCPKCETIFRLSREQLDIADGQVSCSVCQFEFDAYECLTPDPENRNTATPPAEDEDAIGSDLVPIIIVEDSDDDDEMSVLFSASLEEQDGLHNVIDLARFEAAEPESEQGPEPEPEPDPAFDAIPEYMESADSNHDLDANPDSAPDSTPDSEPGPGPVRLSEQLESELMEAGLHNAAAATHRMHRLAWSSGAVVLILALGLQYIYVIRNELAQSNSYRPWIESYCNIIGCDIPLRRQLQSIELLQREIAQDPKQDNVLRVRAMFVNQARFRQAYPVVQVTLSDTNNQVIAMRRVKPEEYLDKQSIGQGMIPGRQVTLDLRFFKPEQAVSTYEFDFL